MSPESKAFLIAAPGIKVWTLAENAQQVVDLINSGQAFLVHEERPQPGFPPIVPPMTMQFSDFCGAVVLG